jgi:hypothetical protein
MEDEGFVDDDFIEDTAREFVGRYGADAAVVMLRQRAAIAERAGARLLAQAWRDMAATAEQLID